MADTKVSALSSFTPITTDLLYGVDDPGGTPASGKLAISDIFALAAKSTLAAGTLTADTPHIFSATFNNAAVTFTGKSNDFTDTASNAASLLERWRVGGTTVFSIGKAGTVNIVDFASFANLQNGGGVRSGSGVVWGSMGTNQFAIGDSGGATRIFANVGSGGFLQADAGHFIGWGTTAGQAYNAGDLRLYRDGAGILAQRNGANAQAFRLYNTYTDASNYERGYMRWSSNVLQIGTEAAGTGTARSLLVQSGRAGGGSILFTTAQIIVAPALGLSPSNGAARRVAFFTPADNVVRLNGISDGVGGAFQFQEMTAPSAPGTNEVRIYAEDNGSGKTRLMALFATGAAQQIAIEP